MTTSKGNVRKIVLRNGLTVLAHKSPGFQSVSIGVWIRVGTRHERSNESGMSHFLEHMLFKGTAKRTATEITKTIENVGGEFNAFTTREYTCFHVNLLGQDFELGMDILSDILLNSSFEAEELERERKVILQELSVCEDNPEEFAHDLHFEKVYGRHGLGRSILGNDASVHRFRRSDLLRFYRKHYQPRQVLVSIAGDLSFTRVLEALKPLRKANWSGRKKQKISGYAPAPPMKAGTWWLVRPTEQAHLIWGVEAPHYTARSHAAALVLTAYLGGGMSSVLFQKIRETHGLAYTLYSSLHAFHDSGLLTVYVGCSPSQVHNCIRLIEEAISEISHAKFDLKEFEDVRNSLKGTMRISMDSVEHQMQNQAIDEIYFHDHFTVDEVCAELDQVSPADVRKLVRSMIRANRRSTLVYGPRPSKLVRDKLKPIITK